MVIFILLFGLLTNYTAHAESWIHHDNLVPKFGVATSSSDRFPRATDEDFSTTIDRIQKVARISNAISLQQGITNGTLPYDTVISELLNFGDVTPTVIQSIDSSELTKLVKDIGEFSKTLAEDAGVKKIEERLIILGKIYKETKGVESVEKPEGYLEAAKKLQKNLVKVDSTKIDVLVGYFRDAQPKMKQLEEGNLDSAEKIFSEIVFLAKHIRDKDYSSYVTDLKVDILRESELFIPMIAFANSMNSFEKAKNYYDLNKDPAHFSKLKIQMETLGSVIDRSSTHIEPIKILKKILISRHHLSGNRALLQTAGFPNGFSDIDSVFKDLLDPWIRKVVQGQSKNLETSLSQLRSISKDSRLIFDALGPIENSQEIQSVHLELLKLSKIKNEYTSMAPKLTAISEEAQKQQKIPSNTDKFVALHGNIIKLATKLKAIDSLLSTVTHLKSQKSEDLKFIIDKTSTYSEDNLKVLKSSQQYQDFFKVISNLTDSLSVLEKGSSIKEPLNTVVTDYGQVDTYVSELNPFVEMVKTLKQTPELEVAESLILGLRECRKIKIKNFEPIAKKIEDVKPKLKTLEKSLKLKNAESQVHMLQDMLPASQVIGNSARVVLGIQKVLNGKKKWILNAGLAKDDTVAQKSLEDLNKLLQTFQKESDVFKNSTKLPQTLQSISDVFTLAKKITGVPIDLLSLAKSVQKLAESSKTQKPELLEIQKTLETLDTFGLDFSRHQKSLGESKKSLDTLDLFFTTFQSRNTQTTPIPSKIVPAQSGASAATGNSEQNSRTFYEKNSHWLLGSIVILALGLGAGGGGYMWYKWYMDKKPKVVRISKSLFEVFFSDWTLKFRTWQVKWQTMPSWPDSIKLYFSSFYAQSSSETMAEVSDSVIGLTSHYRCQVAYGKTNRFAIKNKKKIGKGRVHGNGVKLPNKQMYWLTQIPQADCTVAGSEKVGNISMFWMGVVEKKSKFVMCLSRDADGKPLPYLPLEVGTKKYADNLSIECTKVEKLFEDQVVKRELIVKFPGMKRRRVTHVHYIGWPDNGIPRSTEPLVHMYKMVELSRYPVFINCNDGISKCGAFTQAIIHLQMLEEYNGQLAFSTSLNRLRQCRQMAVSSEQDYMFVALLTFKLIIQAVNQEKLNARSKTDIKKFNGFIDAILAGKATWTNAKLAPFVAPAAAPPPAPPRPPAVAPNAPNAPNASNAPNAPNTPSVASVASTATPSTMTAPVEPPPKKNKNKQKKKMKLPLPSSRFPDIDSAVNRTAYVSNAKNLFDASKEQLEKVKKKKSKMWGRTVVEDEDDLDVDVPDVTIDETQQQQEDVPPPPEELEQATAEDVETNNSADPPPPPLGVLSSETRVEMPEASPPPPAPPAP